MKLIIATGTFLPEISGQSTFVSNLFVGLKSGGVEVIVISYSKNFADRKNEIFFVKRNFLRFFNYWMLLKKQLKNNKKAKNIIYAQDLVSSGLPSAAVKGKNRLVVRIGGDFLWEKMVNSGRCEVPLRQYYNRPKSLKEKFYLIIYKFVLGRCDKIIFNNNLQKDIYSKFFKLSEEKIELIGNPLLGVAAEKFKYSKEKKSNEIIYAGRFIPIKNLERLIEAFKKIEKDYKLVLIGDGPQKNKIEELSKDDERIKVETEIDQEQLFRRITNASMVVLPSLSDMSPNIVLEALSLGCPVVLTKENGLPENIKSQCLLINPMNVEDIKNGILQALEKKSDNLTSEGRLESVNNWQEVADQHLKLFERL